MDYMCRLNSPAHGTWKSLSQLCVDSSVSLPPRPTLPNLHDIGSIPPSPFTHTNPGLFLDYGRCLHSTYLRKEVRTVGSMSNSPAMHLLSRPHLNHLSPGIPLPRLPRKSSGRLLAHPYPGYAVPSWPSSVDADGSATEIAASGSRLPTLLRRRVCTLPAHGTPFMLRFLLSINMNRT